MCETNQASFCKVPSGCQHFDVFFLGDLCTDAVFGEISTVLAARLLRLCYLRSGWVWEEQIFVAWVTGEVSDRGAEKMFKLEHPHFVTGNFTPQNVFLGDREYGLALDCLVKACTDLLLLNSDQPDCKVLLGKRIVEPQPDWWYNFSLLHLLFSASMRQLVVEYFSFRIADHGSLSILMLHGESETHLLDTPITHIENLNRVDCL